MGLTSQKIPWRTKQQQQFIKKGRTKENGFVFLFHSLEWRMLWYIFYTDRMNRSRFRTWVTVAALNRLVSDNICPFLRLSSSLVFICLFFRPLDGACVRHPPLTCLCQQSQIQRHPPPPPPLHSKKFPDDGRGKVMGVASASSAHSKWWIFIWAPIKGSGDVRNQQMRS